MRVEFFKILEEMFAKDDKIVLLLGDLGVYTARNLFRDYPNRVYNIGICEQATVSIASGLAKEGFKPIFYSIAPFAVERCLEQIKIDVGYQNLPVSIVSVGGSYDYASLGCTHHCPADVGLMLSIPNMTVLVPGSVADIEHHFTKAHGIEPIYMRLSEHPHNIFNNRKIIITQRMIIAVGTMLPIALDVAEKFNANIFYCNKLPMEFNFLGFQSHIAILEPYYEGTTLPFIPQCNYTKTLSIGVPRRFLTSYGTKEQHDKACGLDKETIKRRLKEFFDE